MNGFARRRRGVNARHQSRPWDDPAVLLCFLAIMFAVVWSIRLAMPHTPGEQSVEAGFLRDMTYHHQLGVDMALATRDRTHDPEIRMLATSMLRIEQLQVGRMLEWLDAWGLPTSSRSTVAPLSWMGHAAAGMSHEVHTDAFWMTGGDFGLLVSLPPDQADIEFLRQMTWHHQIGLAMAQAALALSANEPVRRLATQIAANEQADIGAMQTLLRRKGISLATPPPGADVARLDTATAPWWTTTPAATLFAAGRVLPLIGGLFAAVWLNADAQRRRRVRTGVRTKPNSVWLAVGGLSLLLSGMLYAGVATARFGAAAEHGFPLAGVAALEVIVAAILVGCPTRPVYRAGAVLSGVGLVLSGSMLVVAPFTLHVNWLPRTIGLFSVAAQATAMLAWAQLWRDRPLSSTFFNGDGAVDAAVSGSTNMRQP